MALVLCCMGVPTMPGELATLLCRASVRSVNPAVMSVASRFSPTRSVRCTWVFFVMTTPEIHVLHRQFERGYDASPDGDYYSSPRTAWIVDGLRERVNSVRSYA